jgi:hypothetical protein
MGNMNNGTLFWNINIIKCRHLIKIFRDNLIIKARRMRWAGHVARMGENRNAYGW